MREINGVKRVKIGEEKPSGGCERRTGEVTYEFSTAFRAVLPHCVINTVEEYGREYEEDNVFVAQKTVDAVKERELVCEEHVYLLAEKHERHECDDKYDEYMVIDGVPEKVGSWEVNLEEYAKKLMFEMNEDEYKTLEAEFEVILKQMEFIDNIKDIFAV